MKPTTLPVSALNSEPTGPDGIFRRIGAWLFSQKHFHIKLLLGTGVGVFVIIFLAAVFLFVTYRNHHQDTLRTHTIEVMRTSSVIENDIAALEAGHRGFLLTSQETYLTTFSRRRDLIQERLEQLHSLIIDNSRQRKRIMKVQEAVQKWLDTVARPEIEARRSGRSSFSTNLAAAEKQRLSIAAGTALLEDARKILQSIQDEEQIFLNEQTQEQEWATQSTQILNFLPKLERSFSEMQKEKRGYLLTGADNFVEGYKRAAADFYTFHGHLSVLVANDAAQAESLATIRSAVERWITLSAIPEMEARRAGRDVLPLMAAGLGEKLMSEVHDLMGNFEKHQLDLYEMRAAAAKRERIITTSGLAILCFTAAALLIVSSCYSFVLSKRQLGNVQGALTKLEGAEVRIRSVVENILDGMITVDEEGVIQSMNPASEKMFGCINNELVGRPFVKLVPKSYGAGPDAEPVPCAWAELATRTGSTTLAVGRTRTHATFPVEISLSEMIADGKKLFVAMIRDVTERRRFEQEIAAEKESLAVTLRSIGDGVITMDMNGNIIMMNNAGETLTGWSLKDAIGKHLKTVYTTSADHAGHARTQKTGYRNEAQSILARLPSTATLTSRDNKEITVEQVASPIRDSKNEISGVVLVFRDITERQRSEAEQRKAEALEQLGLLAGGIAHDFNNLLTAIIGNISLATLLLPPNDEMSTRLNDAKNAGMRARDLAQQLLTFARGGAPIKTTASIGKLIQDTVSFSLRGTHSRSEFTFGQDLWPADIDPGQISQVVANLVVNADQSMPNGGTLHVHCDNFTYSADTTPAIPDLMAGDYIRVSIRDEGVGIPEKYLKRIFDPYFTTKPKGNGLGLATTYSIIKNHEGLITVQSEVHFGSTFTLYLPASKCEMPVETARPFTPAVTGTGRVLVVDDEEAIRALVNFTLTRLGYDVTEAETALMGIDTYREAFLTGQRFDAVILDLTLPGGMGGKEALKKMIEIDPTVNAIVSSGYAMDATMSRYQDFGFRGVIGKPYEAAELGKIVHQVIESSHLNLLPEYELQQAC